MALWDRLTGRDNAEEKKAKELWDRAIRYLEGKLYNRALKDIQDAIALDQSYFKEAVELMQIFSSQGNDEQSVSLGLALLKYDARNVELMNKLGNALRNLNSFARAKKLYTACLKIKPDFVEARYNLAACSFGIPTADGELQHQTKKAEALTKFRRFEFRPPRQDTYPVNNEDYEPDEKHGKKEQEGEKELDEGDEAEILQLIQMVTNELKSDLEKKPKSWEAEFNLGLMYDLTELGELAITHYRRAQKLVPARPEPTNNLAIAMIQHKGMVNEGEAMLLKGLEINKYDRTIVLNLAMLYRQLNKGFSALKFFVYMGDLMAKSLGQYDLDKAEAHARDLFGRRKYLEAVPFFDNLAKETRQDYWLENLAMMYQSLKKEDEYITTLKRHVRVNPKAVEPAKKLKELSDHYTKLGKDALKSGQKSGAIENLQKAVKIMETPELWVELAELYQDQEEEILAQNALKRWKQLTSAPPPGAPAAKPAAPAAKAAAPAAKPADSATA